MKPVFKIGMFVVTGVALGLIFCLLNGHVIRGKTSAEAADLSGSELVILKQKATQEGDLKSAARIYWYYRFTKRDFVEAKKWEYAVVPPDAKNETNSSN